jgi:hypothetical protein
MPNIANPPTKSKSGIAASAFTRIFGTAFARHLDGEAPTSADVRP